MKIINMIFLIFMLLIEKFSIKKFFRSRLLEFLAHRQWDAEWIT